MNTREEVLLRTNDGLDVFARYLAVPSASSDISKKEYRKLRNPFYADKNPSCCLYQDKKTGKWVFHDHGDPKYHGDCFWFVAMLNNLDVERDFPKVLQIIIRDLNIPIIFSDRAKSVAGTEAPTSKAPAATEPTIKEIQPPKVEKKRRFRIQPLQWSDADLKYWGRYGITKDVLTRYNVKPVDYVTADGKTSTYSVWGKPESPMYGYVFEKFAKLYRPAEKERENRFRIAGNFPSNYCFGLKQLPNYGDILFITGGEKDVMSLAARGFNAICFQSETAKIHIPTLKLARSRFKYIILLYDSDETGVRRMTELTEELKEYDVKALRLPLSGAKVDKDISDFFAKGQTRDDFRQLLKALIREEDTKARILVESCKLDLSIPIAPSEVLVSVNDVPLVSAGGLMCVTGNVGTGKSHFIGALLAGALITDVHPMDTLGVTIAPNYKKKAVLHFDTEQTKAQLTKNEHIMLKRAGLKEAPDFYQSFHLTANSLEERLEVIREALNEWYFEHDGIHMVVIDGVADLLKSPNDEGQSNDLVRELMKLAGMYNTCIICVVHTLPNLPKLRGHLGSELMRKASSIVVIEKDEERKCSLMRTMKVRDGDLYSVPILTFAWSEEAGMFVATGQKEEVKGGKDKRERLVAILNKVFEGKDTIAYGVLCEAIMAEYATTEEISLRTAKTYVRWMRDEGVLTQNEAKQYLLTNPIKNCA